MFFNSLAFLCFFVIVFQLYWLVNNRTHITYRNLLLVVSGYFFYGCWDWKFLGLLFISSTADYIMGLKIDQAQTIQKKKIFLTISIIFNLGILGFFKYFNFFIDSLQELLRLLDISIHTRTLAIVLPVGISFYTFQSLSYTIDIYRNKLKPEKNYLTLLAFVSFFPQLVAGPIERAIHMLPQFREKKLFDYAGCVLGLRLVLWGLFKKVVIADNLAPLVDVIFQPDQIPSPGITILGGMLFAFQIYGDFSGYSDMARGLAKMLGFDLMRNFMTPYSSATMTEFWRRWHISLSTWFRDYVYIPLGGNQKGTAHTNLNILITFVLSGLWHGAKATFLIWGFLHGAILVIEKSVKIKMHTHIRVPFIFLITSLLWIPFRADSFSHLKKMAFSSGSLSGFTDEIQMLILSVHTSEKAVIIFITLILFLILDKKITALNFDEWIQPKSRLVRYGVYYWLLLSVLLLSNLDIKPSFIYFQF